MQFAKPTTDLAFKKLFADLKHKNILIGFLNSMLERTGDERIADAIVSDTNNLPLVKGDRHSVVDVRCTDERGRQYIVEVQVEDHRDFGQRCVYYSARALAAQLQKGQEYKDIVPVIFLGILNFNLFEHSDYISHYLIMNKKTHEVGLHGFEWHFAELQKFTMSEKEIKSDTECWMFLLKNAVKLDHVPAALKACKETDEALKVLDQHLWTKDDLDAYERMLDAERVARSVFETAIEKSKAEGIIEGRDAGMAEGKIEVARQMLAKRFPVEQIAEVTGLNAEEIKKLK